MRRQDCVSLIAQRISNELVVVGGSGVNWEWFSRSDHRGSIHVGSMGHATSIAAGLALALPDRRVVALESDGGALMDLAGLTTIAAQAPENLTIFVFDNEVYSGSRISLPTATAGKTDLQVIAQGAGIESARMIRDLDEMAVVVDWVFDSRELNYLVCKVIDDPETRAFAKPNVDYREGTYRFLRYVEETTGMTILSGLRRP